MVFTQALLTDSLALSYYGAMIPPILTNANDALVTLLSALITILLTGLVLFLALVRRRKQAMAKKGEHATVAK